MCITITCVIHRHCFNIIVKWIGKFSNAYSGLTYWSNPKIQAWPVADVAFSGPLCVNGGVDMS